MLHQIGDGDPNRDRFRQRLIRSAAHEMNLDPPRGQFERRSVLFDLHTGHARERHIAERLASDRSGQLAGEQIGEAGCRLVARAKPARPRQRRMLMFRRMSRRFVQQHRPRPVPPNDRQGAVRMAGGGGGEEPSERRVIGDEILGRSDYRNIGDRDDNGGLNGDATTVCRGRHHADPGVGESGDVS